MLLFCVASNAKKFLIRRPLRNQQCDSESGEDAQRRAKLYKYAGSSPAVKKKISKRAMLRGSGMALSDVENLNKLLSSSLKELDVTSREKYRSDAVQYGMKLLDEERKRSDEEYRSRDPRCIHALPLASWSAI